MGFKVPELTANSKAPLAAGEWEMEFVKFTSGESTKKKTPFVQAVWKLAEDAVDTEGEPYGKRPYYGDTFYLTNNAMWRLKNFAKEAEVEVPSAGDEYDTLAEYAADLTDLFRGAVAVLTTGIESYQTKDDAEGVETGRKSVTESYKF